MLATPRLGRLPRREEIASGCTKTISLENGLTMYWLLGLLFAPAHEPLQDLALLTRGAFLGGLVGLAGDGRRGIAAAGLFPLSILLTAHLHADAQLQLIGAGL